MKYISRVVLPMVLFSYIVVETIMKIQKSSLCSTTGCELAGELLKFDSMYLNVFGAIGALMIALVGYVSIKRDHYSRLFYIVLYSAIAFETIMIAYQMIANPELCIFCLGVYGLLLLTALLSNWKYLLFASPILASMFLSLSSLSIPQNKAIVDSDGYYLIQSQTCPHCVNVKKFMKNNNIAYTPIMSSDTAAIGLLKNLSIKQIPVLLDKQNSRTQVIQGDKIIIEHLKNNSKSQAKEVNKSIYTQEAEGCEASPELTKEAGCEEGSILNESPTRF